MDNWTIKLYDRRGNAEAELSMENESECAKLWAERKKAGYPAPTVWHNGKRVAGY